MMDESHDVIPALSIGAFQATPLGLIVTGLPDYEEWAIYGQGLQIVDAALRWIIGDWLNWGEGHYGDMYTQAIEMTGLKTQLLMNYKWVADRVQNSSRKENLTWSHHALIAPLEPPEQERWLKVAKEEGWSTRELKEAINPSNKPSWKAELLSILTFLEEDCAVGLGGGVGNAVKQAIEILRAHM